MTSIPFADDPLEIQVNQSLTTSGILPRAILRGLWKRPRQLESHDPKRIIVRQNQVTLETQRIASFRRCCEFDGQAGGVPLTFPEICFTPLMAQAMLAPEFPFSPMGIIHMYQRVTQHQRLEAGQSYDACCELAQNAANRSGS